MSKNIINSKDQDDSEDYNSDDNEEYIYQNQYIKVNPMINQNNYYPQDLEEQGIKINLEKIEERAPEEEESCISSLILSKDIKKPKIKKEKNSFFIKKILKYKNKIYYYFNRWKKQLKINSVKKRIKKIKKKKKIINNNKIIKTKKNQNININEIIKNKSIINQKDDVERITNFIKFMDKFIKIRVKKYYEILIKHHFNNKKNETNNYNKIDNNDIKTSFSNNNNLDKRIKGFDKKDLKTKKNEIKKPFKIVQINDNKNIKYNESKIYNNNHMNKEIEEKSNNEAIKINEKDNNIKINKIQKSQKKKIIKKVKKNKGQMFKKDFNELKKIVEKVNNKKIISKFFNKWLNFNKINKRIDNKNILNNQLNKKLSENKNKQFINNAFNFKNNEANCHFDINNISSDGDNVMIPIFLKNYIPQDECNINNNFFIGNIDIENKIEEILKNDVEIQKRKYKSEEDPKINEHTFRVIKLSKPIKEIEDTKNGNIEIRVPEEYIEYGTEITRYPSEITETITTTTKIISDDNANETKVFNSSEEEIIAKDNSIKKLNYDFKNISENQNCKNDFEVNNKYSITNNIKENKNHYIKNQRSNIIIKENEVPKIIKKRNTESPNISKEDDYERIEVNEKNYHTNNSEPKFLLDKNKNNFFLEEKNQQNEEEKYNSLKNNNINIDEYFKNNSSNKEIIKTEKSGTNKKTKNLIRKYKKALHLLRRVMKGRKKRKKKNFFPEVKKKYYFELWKTKSFPEGIEIYRSQKNREKINGNLTCPEKENDINNNEDNNDIDSIINLNKKEKIINIINIIRINRKKNKKIKLKLKEMDNELDKIYFCFNLWYKNTLDENDDEDEQQEENEIKKNINNININILKKIILLHEIRYKKLYLKKWKELLLKKNKKILYSKPISIHSNPVKSPIFTNFRKSGKIKNIKEIFLKENQKEKEMEILENKKEIINTGINSLYNKNNQGNFSKSNLINEEKFKTDENKNVYIKIDNIFEEMKKEYFTKVSDIENETINNKKEDNNNTNIYNILNKVFEKINNKNYLYFFFIKWYNIIILKKRRSEKSIFPGENITKIRQFSQIKENNIINIKANYNKYNNKNYLKNNSKNFGINQKRIFINNELSENRKRANTLLSFQNIGHLNISDSNIIDNYNDDNDDKSEQIKIINPIKRLSYININSEEPKNFDENNNIVNINFKMNERILNREEIPLINDIYALNNKNINLMNKNLNIIKKVKDKNLSNKIFFDNYYNLLKQYYKNISAFQIVYLYSLFDKENEQLKINNIFNKWKKLK